MNSNVFIALRAELRTRMNDVSDSMSNGDCRDFAQYQRMVGEMEGLARAERMLLDVEKALKRQELGDDPDDEEGA